MDTKEEVDAIKYYKIYHKALLDIKEILNEPVANSHDKMYKLEKLNKLINEINI